MRSALPSVLAGLLRSDRGTTWGLSRFSRSENGTVPLRKAEVILRLVLLVGLIGCGGEDSAEPGKPAPGAAPAEATGLSFVSDEFFAAVVLHPARIAKSSLVKSLLEMEPVRAEMKRVGLQPADVERLMVLLPASDAERMGPGFGSGAIVVRLVEPFDIKERLTELRSAMMPGFGGELAEKTIQGKTCYQISPPMPVVAFAVDEQTMVLTDEETASSMLSPERKQGPLAQRLEQVDMDNDAVAVITLDPVRDLVRRRVEQGKENLPPPLAGLAELPDMLAALTLSVDLSGDTLLKAVVEATDAESATKVQELLKGALEMGKTMFKGFKQQIPDEDRQQAATALTLADQGLAGLSIRRDGKQITVTLKRPEGFNESVAAMVAEAMKAAREAAQRAQQINNMKEIAIAMHNYHDVHKAFPPAATRDADGKPLLSWRVELLPYLEELELYEKFKRDEPWDSPHNLQLAKQTPEVFLSVGRANDGKTSIMVFTGEGTPFAGPKGPRFANILDGTANTIMLVEAGPDKAVPWTKPEDLPFDPDDPMAALGEIPETGFLAAFFDAHCEVISRSLDPETLKAMITPAGGEPAAP